MAHPVLQLDCEPGLDGPAHLFGRDEAQLLGRLDKKMSSEGPKKMNCEKSENTEQTRA